MPPALIGEVIGGYRVEGLLGRGGMGAVYVGSHLKLNRKAAIKVLAPKLTGDQDFVSRFFFEAKVVNEVRHPNVIDIFDFVEIEQPHRVALIMELLEGPTLSEVVRRRPLDVVPALNMGIQLADALVTVHAAGVIHRDLKPQNIVLIGDLSGDLAPVPSVKLLDFGIAKAAELEGASHHTATGSVLGTPAYMAPEQVVGEQATRATDVYALAETLYEALSGRRLFGGTPMAIFKAKLQPAEAHDLSPLHDRLGPGSSLESLLRRCVVEAPAARPLMSELRDGLVAILADIAPTGSAAPHRRASSAGSRPEPSPEQSTIVEGPRAQPAPEPVLAPAQPPPPPTVLSPVERPLSSRAPSVLDVRVAPKRKKRAPWLPISLGAVVCLATGAALLFARDRPAQRAKTPAAAMEADPLWAVIESWRRAVPTSSISGDAEAELMIAWTEHQRGDLGGYQRAEAALERALIAEPGDVEAVARWLENLLAAAVVPPAKAELRLYHQILDAASKRAPAHPALPRARAALAIAERDWLSAQRFAEQAAAASPEDPRALLWLAEVLAESDPEQAIARAADARARAPGLQRTARVVARAHVRAGRYKAAERVLTDRVGADADDVHAWIELGDLELELGRPDQAMKRYKRAAAAGPQLWPAKLALARAALEAGSSAEALTSLQAITNDPATPPLAAALAFAGLARAELVRNEARRAEAFCDRFQELRSKLEETLELKEAEQAAQLARAEAALLRSDWTTAEQAARRVLDARPGEAAAWIVIGRVARHRHAADEGLRAFQEAIRGAPWTLAPRVMLASLYLEYDRKAQAAAAFEGAADQDPEERERRPYDVRFRIPDAAVQEAMTAVESALNSRGDQPSELAAGLGLARLEMGDVAKARRLLTLAQRGQRDPLSYVLEASLAYAAGAGKVMEAAGDNLARTRPGSPVGPLYTGRGYLALGKPVEARAAFVGATNLAPTLALARLELALLRAKESKSDPRPPIVSIARERPELLAPRRALLKLER